MISPTIGRVLLYFTAGNANPWPCLVTAVTDDRTVNVSGFTDAGQHFWERGAKLLQDDDQKPTEGTWCEWMPYQVAAAAKAAPASDTSAESSGPVSA